MDLPAPIPRRAEETVRDALADTRVVVLHGPRQSGKSTLARAIGSSIRGAVYLTFDDERTRSAALADPSEFVRRDGLAVLDEIQRVPEVLLAIKSNVDRDPRPGRFLLTGSAHVLSLPRLADSLAGRIELVPLLPLSRGEILRRRETFVDRAFASDLPDVAAGATDRRAVLEIACTGGFPEAVARPDPRRRARWFDDYVATLVRRDVRDLAEIDRPDVLTRLVRVLAARATDLLNYDGLARDVRLSPTTVRRYVSLLRAVFLADELPAWETNRTLRATRAPKVHFIDSGLAAHLLGATAESLSDPLGEAGRVVETFVVSEIRKQAAWSAVRPALQHYRSKDGAEVDLILEAPDGRIVGVEVKSGTSVTARSFSGLRHVAARTGRKFTAGVVLYTGPDRLPFGDRLWAMPISTLWE